MQLQNSKYGKRVFKNLHLSVCIVQMSEVTGLPRWLCKNVLHWRYRRGLPIVIRKAL